MESKTLVQRAMRIIQTEGPRGLAVESLAKQLGVTCRKLQREFKDRLDTTPSQVIRDVRLERAKQLLAETDEPLSTIALLVGFAEPSALSQFVQRHSGMSPRDHRIAARRAAAKSNLGQLHSRKS